MFKIWLNLQLRSAGTKATAVETHINIYTPARHGHSRRLVSYPCAIAAVEYPRLLRRVFDLFQSVSVVIYVAPLRWKFNLRFGFGHIGYLKLEFQETFTVICPIAYQDHYHRKNSRQFDILGYHRLWSLGIRCVAIGVYARF